MLEIRKRVSLEFLGDEYSDSYLTFKAIPLKDFEKIQKDIEVIGDDNIKSINFICQKLKDYFLDGKAPGNDGLEPVKVEDLDNLDQETAIKCFQTLTGQSVNEDNDFLDKDSNKQSSTAEDNPTNS